MIRKADKNDIDQIVNIHIRALPDDLLPKLGIDYLSNEFYPKVVLSPDALVLVEENSGIVRGFCIFALNSLKLTQQVTSNKLLLGYYFFLALLKDIRFISDLGPFIFGSRYELADGENEEVLHMTPEIYIIAVSPDFQKMGVGKEIVKVGFNQLVGKKSRCLVKTSSIKSKEFYLHLGFTQIGLEFRGKKILYILINDMAKNLENFK
jgi:ribosomal protein S18 acetylase RimI-like enzyme